MVGLAGRTIRGLGRGLLSSSRGVRRVSVRVFEAVDR